MSGKRDARIAGALLAESVEPLGWWWLSFTDASRPKGSQFLGVAIVEARGIAGAVTAAHRLGINPGGAVLAIAIPPEHVPALSYRNRLLSRDEAEAL